MSREPMPLVFVAGPHRAPNPSGILRNAMAAREFCVKLWQEFGKKAFFFCPSLNMFMMDGECQDEVWLKADHFFLRRCDAMIMRPGWVKSTGSRAEVRIALRLKIPVFATTIQLEQWLKNGSVPDNEYELRQLSAKRPEERKKPVRRFL